MDEFDHLKQLPIPEPDARKKAAALAAAMQAFDQAQEKSTQGNARQSRLKEATHHFLRSFTMNKKHLLAGSAIAIVLCVAISHTVAPEFLRPQNEKQNITIQPPSQPAAPYEEDGLTITPPAKEEQSKPQPEAKPDKKAKDEEISAVTVQAPALTPPASSAVEEKKSMLGAGAPMPEMAKMRADSTGNAGAAFAPEPMPQPYYQDVGRDKFEHVESNGFKQVKADPVSTFSIDVDTASYSFIRRQLNQGVLPQQDAVRVEEMINYFDYNYAVPESKALPFKPTIRLMATPWNHNTKLIQIGIKGYELPQSSAPHANLVFLVDTSGSMNSPDKLPLLKSSLRLLVNNLRDDDTVAIVTYAGSAGTALEPTPAKERAKILSVIDGLGAGGSTAGAAGIQQAYALAKQSYDDKGVNRVILATDGDFNVGITDTNELKSYIEHERESGISLSVLGFGEGNYNDALMQALAQNGNGNAAYIDTLNEARKVLVDQAGATLFTIAKDVKIQVEFNPATVAEYRLIGYETRALKREDFNNDAVDAGEVGVGHTVTAIYEITPVGNPQQIEPTRYEEKPAPASADKTAEYAFLKIRYKLPDASASTLMTTPISQKNAGLGLVDRDTAFSAAVAAFGQKLRGDGAVGSFSYDDIIALAEKGKGPDRSGMRAEFINLVKLAKSASGEATPVLPVEE